MVTQVVRLTEDVADIPVHRNGGTRQQKPANDDRAHERVTHDVVCRCS